MPHINFLTREKNCVCGRNAVASHEFVSHVKRIVAADVMHDVPNTEFIDGVRSRDEQQGNDVVTVCEFFSDARIIVWCRGPIDFSQM